MKELQSRVVTVRMTKSLHSRLSQVVWDYNVLRNPGMPKLSMNEVGVTSIEKRVNELEQQVREKENAQAQI